MSKTRVVVVLGMLLCLVGAHARAMAMDSRSCAQYLAKIHLRNSGQDQDMQEKIREAARIVYQEIAPKLGLDIPDMVITTLNADDMIALTSAGGHPAPHWYDGVQVVRNAGRAGGILEFVVRGQQADLQYIRDTNSLHETLLVLAHVAGHYDFSKTAPIFSARNPDQMTYSRELAELMTRLYGERKKGEVSEFYQWLISTRMLQDLSRGSFVSPEEMDPRAEKPAPTESVLQAFARALRALAGGKTVWKGEMARLYELVHRVVPAVVGTKVMNEGWATLMEYIILAHSPWKASSDAVFFGKINQGVTRASLENPYWLGLQAWMRVRDRFLERDEIKGLSPIEQDRRFIAEAHRMMRQYTDYSFLLMALDERWVARHNLVLYRPANKDVDPLPEELAEKKNIAVTRDSRRIVKHIANRTVNHDFHFPKIELVSFGRTPDEPVRLRHVPVLETPLRRETMSKTLYVLSKIAEKPVSLDTIGVSVWMTAEGRKVFVSTPVGMVEQTSDGSPRQALESVRTFPIRITVSPNGKVTVESLVDESSSAHLGVGIFLNQSHLEEILQEGVVRYVAEAGISYEKEMRASETVAFREETGRGEGASVDRLPNDMSHAPTAAQAVLEYMSFVKERRARFLRLAIQGKVPIIFSADGRHVKLQTLPEVPEFELENDILVSRLKGMRPTPVDRRMGSLSLVKAEEKASEEPQPLLDGDLDIGQGPWSPGDIWDRRGGGSGEGQGSERGRAGEEGSEDVNIDEIPIETYGEMLAEMIELRNLRRTEGGENPLDEDIRTGSEHRSGGNILWAQTAREAYGKGMAIARKNGKDFRKMTPAEIIRLGMKYVSPENYVVSSRDEEPVPQLDAVIVYVADTSGSMDEEDRRIERLMVANTRALLKVRYPHLKEHFVIYDTNAKEVNEEEFFTTYLGGGTRAAVAYKLAREILSRYPQQRFNRFSLLFSDGDDANAGVSVAEGTKLAEMTEYTAYGHVDPKGGDEGRLSEEFKRLSLEEPDKIGFSVLDSSSVSIFDAIREYFGKKGSLER